MVSSSTNLGHITHPVPKIHHLEPNPRIWRTAEGSRPKRVQCTTCDGKGCVGRCHFEKLQ